MFLVENELGSVNNLLKRSAACDWRGYQGSLMFNKTPQIRFDIWDRPWKLQVQGFDLLFRLWKNVSGLWLGLTIQIYYTIYDSILKCYTVRVCVYIYIYIQTHSLSGLIQGLLDILCLSAWFPLVGWSILSMDVKGIIGSRGFVA